MQNTVVFLIRHGEIDNPKKIIYGQNIDLPLNAKGREQILNLGNTIQKKGYHPSIIFSSHLSRAVDSAKVMLEFFSIPKISIVIDKGLADNNIPVFAGKPITELAKLDKRGIDEYDDQFVKKGNESKQDIIDRMYSVFQRIINGNLGKTIIAVSHGDPVRLLMFKLADKKLKDIPLAGSREFRKIDYLEKGEAWKIILNKDYRIIDKELIRSSV